MWETVEIKARKGRVAETKERRKERKRRKKTRREGGGKETEEEKTINVKRVAEE